MNFTDSPYESEMQKAPHVIRPLGVKQLFRKEIINSESCKSCHYGKEQMGICEWMQCPCLQSRIKARDITLLELIPPIIFLSKDEKYIRRLIKLYQNIKGGKTDTMIKDKYHQEEFEKMIKNYDDRGIVLTNRFTAVLFLLTADPFLWKRAKRFVQPNSIELKKVNIKGISTDGYLLYKAAKDILFRTSKVSVGELTDKLITSDKCFKVIINAFVIARYGRDTVELDLKPRKEKKDE